MQNPKPTSKSELFSIGDMAKALGITRRIILNYEDHGLIQPDVKDGPTGNRYYSIDAFANLRVIRTMQCLGLSLDEIRGYMIDSEDLMPKIHRLEKIRDDLTASIEKLYERSTEASNTIKEVNMDEQSIYRYKSFSGTVEEKVGIMRKLARKALRDYGVELTRRLYFIQFDMNNPNELSFCVTVSSKCKDEAIEIIPQAKGICLYFHGSYEDIGKAEKMLLDYAEEHKLQHTGIFRQIFVEGPPHHKDPEKYITQVVLLLK